LFLLLKNALNLLLPGARKAGSVKYNVQVQTKSFIMSFGYGEKTSRDSVQEQHKQEWVLLQCC